MTKITKHVDEANNRVEYVLDGRSLIASPNQRRAAFRKLELTQRIEENISFFWSSKCFRWFSEIIKQTKSLVSAERTKLKIQKYSSAKYLWYRSVMNELEKRIEESKTIVDRIQSCLSQNNMQELQDLSSDVLSEDYKKFFTKGAWFEILVFSLFRELKVRNAEFREAEELLNYHIIGKSGLQNEVDVTVITPKHITIVEAKTGKNVKVEDLKKLMMEKADLNADVAVLVSLAKSPPEKAQLENVFIFDEASSYEFDEALDVIDGYYQ